VEAWRMRNCLLRRPILESNSHLDGGTAGRDGLAQSTGVTRLVRVAVRSLWIVIKEQSYSAESWRARTVETTKPVALNCFLVVYWNN